MMRKMFLKGRAFSPARAGATLAGIFSLCLANASLAYQNVSLAWDPSTGTNVAGYYIYLGTNSTNYTSKLDVGMNTMATVTSLSGRSTKYYFTVTAYDNSRMESPPSNQANFTTSSNAGPALTAAPALVNANVNSLVVFTNKAVDTDVAPKLTYSLDAGAPAGMRVDTNTGRLIWMPHIDAGGTTNSVTMRVTDGGGLYNTQSFSVVVSNAVQINLAPAVVALGQAATIQLSTICSSPVTNITFVLDAPSNRVTNVTVTSLMPTIASVTQSPVGAAHSTITIKALSGQFLSGTQAVAQITFTALNGLPSTFATGAISNVTALLSSSQPVPRNFTFNSQLVLVGTQPLSKSMVLTNGQKCLYLYGPSGKTFAIQSSLNPMSTNGWTTEVTSAVMTTNLTQWFTNLPTSSVPKYYRILAL